MEPVGSHGTQPPHGYEPQLPQFAFSQYSSTASVLSQVAFRSEMPTVARNGRKPVEAQSLSTDEQFAVPQSPPQQHGRVLTWRSSGTTRTQATRRRTGRRAARQR
jgi:hypothetical protein